jgi:hypothetical protein
MRRPTANGGHTLEVAMTSEVVVTGSPYISRH